MADIPTVAEVLNGAPPTKVNLRYTHPNLYLSLMIAAITCVGLGVNFLLTTPTFQQYDIPKNVVGAGFLALGVAKLVLLNLWRNLRALRATVIVAIVYMLFWGVGTTETAFAGESSFQLCVLYFGLAGLHVPLLLEPFFNPVTANGKVELDE
jgi:hypothetical protein